MKCKLPLLAVAAVFIAGQAMAQSPSPTPAKPSLLSRMKASAHATPAPVASAKPVGPASKPVAVGNGQAPRTAKSLACSKQADAQNVHGQARKSFMSHCKKA